MPFNTTVKTRFDNMHQIYKELAIYAARNGSFDLLTSLVKNDFRENAYYNLLSKLGNDEFYLNIRFEILNHLYEKLSSVSGHNLTEEMKEEINDSLSSLIVSKIEDYKDSLTHIKFEVLEKSLTKIPLTAERKKIIEQEMESTCDAMHLECLNYMIAILKQQYRIVEVLDILKKEMSNLEVKLTKTKIQKTQVSNEMSTHDADLQNEQLLSIKKYFHLSSMPSDSHNSELNFNFEVPEIFIKVITAKTIQELDAAGWYTDPDNSASLEVEKINALRELLCINSPAVSVHTVKDNHDLLAIALQSKSMSHLLTAAFLLLYGASAKDEYFDGHVLRTSYSVLEESKFLLNVFKKLENFRSEISKSSADNILDNYKMIEEKYKSHMNKLRSDSPEKLSGNELRNDYEKLKKHVDELIKKYKAKKHSQQSIAEFEKIWRVCKEKYRETLWYGFDNKFIDHVSEVTKSGTLVSEYYSVHKKLKKIVERFKNDDSYGNHNTDLTSSPLQMPPVIQQRIAEIARIESQKAISNLESRIAELELKHVETHKSVSGLKRSQEIQETRLATMQHESEERILKLQEEMHEKSEDRILKLQEKLKRESEQAQRESEERILKLQEDTQEKSEARLLEMQKKSEKRVYKVIQNSQDNFSQLMSRMLDLTLSKQATYNSQNDTQPNPTDDYQVGTQPFFYKSNIKHEKKSSLSSVPEDSSYEK